jgi:hypothetical protein
MTKTSFDLWMIGLLYVLAPKWIYGASKEFNSMIDYALYMCHNRTWNISALHRKNRLDREI